MEPTPSMLERIEMFDAAGYERRIELIAGRVVAEVELYHRTGHLTLGQMIEALQRIHTWAQGIADDETAVKLQRQLERGMILPAEFHAAIGRHFAPIDL